MTISTNLYDIFCDVVNNFDGEVYSDYSGRGMYGKNCIGFVCSDMREFNRIMLSILLDNDLDEDETDTVRNMMEEFREDSMAMDRIYYFPSVSKPE